MMVSVCPAPSRRSNEQALRLFCRQGAAIRWVKGGGYSEPGGSRNLLWRFLYGGIADGKTFLPSNAGFRITAYQHSGSKETGLLRKKPREISIFFVVSQTVSALRQRVRRIPDLSKKYLSVP